jgi:hypothetical protein
LIINHRNIYFADRRARLATDTLTDIMVVKSESPAVENFNPSEAISNWLVNKLLKLQKPVFSLH